MSNWWTWVTFAKYVCKENCFEISQKFLDYLNATVMFPVKPHFHAKFFLHRLSLDGWISGSANSHSHGSWTPLWCLQVRYFSFFSTPSFYFLFGFYSSNFNILKQVLSYRTSYVKKRVGLFLKQMETTRIEFLLTPCESRSFILFRFFFSSNS